MFTVDCYIPTRVVFGLNRLEELATMKLPGTKALICVTSDGLMSKLGIQQRVLDLLKSNGVESVVFDHILPNPNREAVMEAAGLAAREGCDFFIGLGGGSSIDTAKAAALVLKNGGELWDYASTGSGGRKEILGAAPIVTISTTCGTGTETDPYCVITKEETAEKLDFAHDAIFPTLSLIDPALMTSLPQKQTMYQGFDAFFHASECYITNNHTNRLLDVYAEDAMRTVFQWLPAAVRDGQDLEARTNMSYAANILCGYTQSICTVTTHHIIAQTLGGMYTGFIHGATLIVIAKEFYTSLVPHFPELLDQMGEVVGVAADPQQPGTGFVRALQQLMDATGAGEVTMSSFGSIPEDFQRVADITVDVTGIDWDRYVMSKDEIVSVLEKSYR